MSALTALEALTDPEAEAVDAWRRRLYPPKGVDPLAEARAITERRDAIAALRSAAKLEREQAQADAAARRKAAEEAARGDAQEVARWARELYPERHREEGA